MCIILYMDRNVDILIIGAHPDDAEVGCAGTIIKAVKSGLTVGVLDITRGEAGSRGDIQTRALEAEASANILGLKFRDNLCMPDCGLIDSMDGREKIAAKLRQYRPKIVFSTAPFDRHPDHAAVGDMVKAAFMYSRLKNREIIDENGQKTVCHSAERLYFYPMHEVENISFVIDITDVFEGKMEAIKAFSSQFYGKKIDGYLPIGTDDYPHTIANRAGYFGTFIRKKYGEGFIAASPLILEVDDL